MGTDVWNKVREVNLADACHMTDALVDGILDSMDTSYKTLRRHLKDQGQGANGELHTERSSPPPDLFG